MDKRELTEELKKEIDNLERLEKEMEILLSSLKEELTFKEIRAAGSILHDFYSGIEKIFEKIALVIDKRLPKGESWHIELLEQMVKPVTDIRPQIISKESLFEKLKELLRFRHLFRHIYGFELKWETIKPLSLSLSEVFEELKKEIMKFLDYIEKE